MPQADLVLLHAPSVYDFRKQDILYGPISDQTPAAEQFEIFPLGFLSMAGHLEANGFRVRIVNLAARMLADPAFSVERIISRLKPALFGIDLHWLPHAHGALEVAALVKKLHPDIPLVLGGLSSSYYHQEIMRDFPAVDYLLRGDCCEEPLRLLLASLRAGGGELSAVPNLCWRQGAEVRVNPLAHVPATLGGLRFDYRLAVKMAVRYLDFKSPLPFNRWPRYPISGLFSCRGCAHNCAFCGGSATAFKGYYGRSQPAFNPAEQLAEDLAIAASLFRGPIFLLGDLRELGDSAMRLFLEKAAALGVKNEVVIEVFRPATAEFFRQVHKAFPRYNLQFTPDSHDQKVRQAMGKWNYADDQIEATIQAALDNGCRRFDVFFMSGLSQQTAGSVFDTVEYCGELLRRYGRQGRLHPYLSLLSPFVDPGSSIFEEPQRFGYKLEANTLAQHRDLLLRPAWTDRLNYQTKWLDRAQLGEVTLEGLMKLTAHKSKYGLINTRTATRAMRRYETAAELDAMIRGKDILDSHLVDKVRQANASMVSERFELEWPGKGVRLWGVAKALLSGR